MSKAAAEQSRLSIGALTAVPRLCASLSHIPDVTLHPICADPFQRLITLAGRPVHLQRPYSSFIEGKAIRCSALYRFLV